MAPDRHLAMRDFLQDAGWADARHSPLAGDASARRYLRLTRPGGATAIVMDAPPAACPTPRAFVPTARHLSGNGFSTPAILHQDLPQGFLLLEDLGDDLFARVTRRDPAQAKRLYLAATDVLAALHEVAPPEICTPLGPADLAAMIGLTWKWYPAADATGPQAAIAEMAAALEALAPARPVMALRDFHAENLIWLPDRAGLRRVGLLDFQDAFTGHPAYDLASLTRDARRDVPQALARLAIRQYAERTGALLGDVTLAATLLAVQRNLRILGVFARLARRDAKPGYLAFMPRLWACLMRDLAHPALAALRKIVIAHLPPPTPSLLKELKAACPTAPTPQ